MILIVDYKVGNPLALKKMIEKLGEEAIISDNPNDIEKASRIIITGVGSFDVGMKNLDDLGFVNILNKAVLIDKKPILGICLGMQLMFNSSEEGTQKGLGWLDANFKRFKEKNLKVPHMGWNYINVLSRKTLYKDILETTKLKFYFDHSYYLPSFDKRYISSSTNHGIDFPVSIEKDNIFAVQYHPEKSLKFGFIVLKNFLVFNHGS